MPRNGGGGQQASQFGRRLDAAAAQVLADSSGRQALVYTGSRHGAIPLLLITDPVLEPVDKVLWMVTATRVEADGVSGTLPGYQELARLANIRSSSTVARAFAILRASRWLTLCREVRDRRGRFRGNVYALHDEPLPLADNLALDARYLEFLQQALDHGHARVRAVAAAVQHSIDTDVADGRHGQPSPMPLERRLRAAAVALENGDGRYFAFTTDTLTSLREPSVRPVGDAVHRVRNSKPDNSSSNLFKTTTTTATPPSPAAVAEDAALELPAQMNRAHRTLAFKHLGTVPAELRQAVLDELEGRLLAERRGAKPVWDVMAYLARLCERARNGELQPNLGLAVAEARRQRAERRLECREETRQPAQRDPEVARQNITRLRQIIAAANLKKP